MNKVSNITKTTIDTDVPLATKVKLFALLLLAAVIWTVFAYAVTQ